MHWKRLGIRARILNKARLAAGMSPAFSPPRMENAAPPVLQSPPDITFACIHCSSPLVVDAAAQGMTLACQTCGKPTPVPSTPAHSDSDAAAQTHLASLKRQLKENESQRTEITGYINQLSIQLHRWQLRLQTLNERRQELDKEVRAAE